MTTIFFILLAIAFVISATAVFLLVRFLRQQKSADKVQDAFRDVAAEFDLTITQQHSLANRVIGFDEAAQKLLFLKISGAEQSGYLVDLDKVRYVEVKKVYELVKSERIDNAENIRLIALQIEYENEARPLQLPFYIKALDPPKEVQTRLEKAYMWQELLLSVIRRRRKTRGNSTAAHSTPGTRFLIRSQYMAGQLN